MSSTPLHKEDKNHRFHLVISVSCIVISSYSHYSKTSTLSSMNTHIFFIRNLALKSVLSFLWKLAFLSTQFLSGFLVGVPFSRNLPNSVIFLRICHFFRNLSRVSFLSSENLSTQFLNFKKNSVLVSYKRVSYKKKSVYQIKNPSHFVIRKVNLSRHIC